MKENSCCVIGHRKIDNSEEFKLKLKNIFLQLIEKENINIFNLGTLGEFNDLCYEILSKLKQDNPKIRLICYALSNEIVFTYEEAENYQNMYNRKDKPFKYKHFDNIIELTDIDETKFKYACVLRNKRMIVDSSICLFHYKEDYSLSSKCGIARNSGTKIAYEYAKNSSKNIIKI